MIALNTHRHRVHVVIRYDDYGAAYSPTCAARLAVEQMLHRETAKRGWPWVCSVTPLQSVDTHRVEETRTVSLDRDPVRVSLLREAVGTGLCEAAVHGLTHHTWKQLPKYGTEFAGRPFEEQFEILCEAKQQTTYFAGRPASVFVPPWNSYDETTVRAAYRAGLTLVSSGLLTYVPSIPPVVTIPATVELIHLRQIMNTGHQYPPGSILVILLHGTDFVTVDNRIGYLSLDDFGPLIDGVCRHFNGQVVPITAVPSLVGPDLDRRGQAAADLMKRHTDLGSLPWGSRIQDQLLPHISALLPTPAEKRVRLGFISLLIAWFMLLGTGSFLGGQLLVRALPSASGKEWASATLVGLGLATLAYCCRNAYLKLFKGYWGTHSIGLRTLGGLTVGMALLISAIYT